MTHDLKTWRDEFQAMCDGTKTFDLRKHDRNFNVDDILHLREWHGEAEYTGREAKFVVRYILYNAREFGLMEGFVIMSVDPVE